MSVATAGIATSDPRATDAAAAALRAGGNAVDAVVTAAFVLFVVEPHYCGVAGDAFVMLSDGRTPPLAYDGSGALPAGLTEDQLREDGLDGVPARGGRSVTVPGALGLLETVLERHGTQTLGEAIAPALDLARLGFHVRPSLAVAARRAAPQIVHDPVLGPLYVPGGSPVGEGDTVRNPDLAACLARVAADGADALYHGALGAALAAAVQQDGGYLTTDDLAVHATLTIGAERVELRGHSVWELPQPTQGPAVLRTLAILGEDGALEGGVDWAAVVAAMREGMAAAGFDPAAMGPRAASPAKGDTTYLAVVDHDGQAVSLITSMFGDFGSHLGVPALGGPVHNRATTLRMLHRPPAAGKPPHTTIPAMVTDAEGSPRVCLGVAGGIMQPQAQVQILVRLLCEDLALQGAIDAPRFKVCFGGDLALELGHPLADEHPAALERDPGPEGFGAAQAVARRGNRLEAAADARRGGVAVLLERE